MASLHRPFFFSAIDKYIGLAITIATTAIVARLLTPDEVGVFIVGGAFVVLAESLREFGTGAYIVQQRTFNAGAIRTAVTAMGLLSVLIAGLLLVVATPIADFYGDPRLIPVVQFAALGVVLGSLGNPAIALLRRDLAFGRLAVINTVGLLVNLVTTLGFIAAGAGYLSLTLGALCATAAVTASAVLYRPQLWVFRPNLTGWREILHFGGFASATAVLNNFYIVLPQALLGRVASFDSASIYSRAVTLCQLPDRAIVNAFQPVIFPAFAAEVRAGRDLGVVYLHALGLLSVVQWPVLVGLALLAEPIVRLILGPQWDAVAPVLRILALAYMSMTPASLTYPTLVAIGRVKDTFTTSLIALPIGTVIMLLAAPHGPAAIAFSMFLSWPLQIVVSFVVIRRRIGIGWRGLALSVWKSVPVTCCAALIPAVVVVRLGFRADLPLWALAIAAIGGALGWLTGLWVTRHPLWIELQRIVAMVRTRLGKPIPAPQG